jgi:hypothetical protein
MLDLSSACMLIIIVYCVSCSPFCDWCKRKLRIKRAIRVPCVSNKLADIPPDDYAWRKYGQKPIKGSPYPRYVHVSYSILSLIQNILLCLQIISVGNVLVDTCKFATQGLICEI